MTPELIQYLSPTGVCEPSVIQQIPEELIPKMYRQMVLTRLWDEKALSLQRQGRLGTFGSVRGQEAANIGMALALQPQDWYIPAFREFGTLFTLGVPLKDQFMLWGGYEQGNRIPEGLRITPTCITVGSHIPHAVGVAYAAKLKGDNSIVMSCSGDGSTSQGAFHEGLNMAAVFQVPYVAVIQNNHWAISLPVEKQTATQTIAEKGAAYAIESARVDGNDVFAVYLTLKKFVERARAESKPALVELVTFRMSDHTTADDSSRYRTPELVAEWEKKDPISRLKIFLTNHLKWKEDQFKQIHEECTKEVNQAVQEYEAVETPSPESMFEEVYSEMPWHLQEQADSFAK